MAVTLPGFNAPAVGFEQPFAMLEACHERVQRTLGLLQRLRDHVRAQGADEQARQAACQRLCQHPGGRSGRRAERLHSCGWAGAAGPIRVNTP